MILDRLYIQTIGLKRTNRRFTTGARPPELHLNCAHPEILSRAGGGRRRLLRCKGSSFSGSFETDSTGTRGSQ
jgi:hypothetical protein